MPPHFQPANPRGLGRPGRSALFHVEQGRPVRALLSMPLEALAAVSPQTASFGPEFCDESQRFARRRTSDGRGCPRRRPRPDRDCPSPAANGPLSAQRPLSAPISWFTRNGSAARLARPRCCRIAPHAAAVEPGHPANLTWRCACATMPRKQLVSGKPRRAPPQDRRDRGAAPHPVVPPARNQWGSPLPLTGKPFGSSFGR